MGGFDWAWFIAVGIGFALGGIDYVMAKARRQKFGRLLLILAGMFVIVGLAGISRDFYMNLASKSARSPSQQTKPNIANPPPEETPTPVHSRQKPRVREPKRSVKGETTTSKQVTPQQTISAPNGIAIGGGIVTNPTVNNNYGQFPPPGVTPKISICFLESNVLAAGEYKSVFTIKTDTPISSPAWWFQFDGPVKEVIPSLESVGFSSTHDHPHPEEIEHSENVVGFALNNIGGIGSQEPLRPRNVVTATLTSPRPVSLIHISGRSLNEHIQENFLYRCGD
jgi:hypothetical protein